MIKPLSLLGALALTVLVLAFWSSQYISDTAKNRLEVRPNFAEFKDVASKKAAFFDYLRPAIAQANAEIDAERNQLLSLIGDPGRTLALSAKMEAWLWSKAIKYRVPDRDNLKPEDWIAALQVRIAAIPESLALAQAANESGWGTSRFALNQNNYFGLWCYTEGCGVRPRSAAEGTTHQVASFETPSAGVAYYLLTLNSHPAYESLRSIRAKALAQSGRVSGTELAAGLIRYSERGQAYVDELQAMIRVNGLEPDPKGS